jgi:hypothetical protein
MPELYDSPNLSEAEHAALDHAGVPGVETSGVLKDYAFANRTSGNVTCNSTTWANVDTGIDLVLAAAAGDTIEVGTSFKWGNEAVWIFLTASTIVGGSPVSHAGPASASGEGVSGWGGAGDSSSTQHRGCSVMFTLVSGDISSGTVTLRLRYRTATAANRTLEANADKPLHWWAKNIGPAL